MAAISKRGKHCTCSFTIRKPKWQKMFNLKLDSCYLFIIAYQVIKAQSLGLATGEVPGSNPGKGDNLLISD